MSTHNLCFDQNYEKISKFLSENFQFLLVKFSVYLNRHVFAMMAMQQCVAKMSLLILCDVFRAASNKALSKVDHCMAARHSKMATIQIQVAFRMLQMLQSTTQKP